MSTAAYEAWREESKHFDYFMVALSGSITAFLTGVVEFKSVGWNPNTLEMVALLFFLGATICGLKRIEAFVTTLAARTFRAALPKPAEGEPEKLTQARQLVDGVFTRFSSKGQRWYQWRNRLLLGGTVLFGLAKIWAGLFD